MRVLPVLLLFAFGCDGARTARDARSAEPGATASSSQPGAADVAVAYQAPAAVVEAGGGAIEFAGRAIEAASILGGAGAPRTYGTLTETDGGRVTYDASPADRVVVQRASGDRFEVLVRDIEGAGQDATSFFQSDHRFRVQVSGPDIDAEVWSARIGPSREAGLRGRVTLDGTEVNADLSLRGTETFDSDQSGSRLFDDHELSGVIERDTDRIDVGEHWTYELVSARLGATGSRMGTASSVVRSVQSVASIGGHRQEWRDVVTRKAFRDGKPNELDTFWEGSGEVVSDGVIVGRVEKFAEAYGESGGFVGFRIQGARGPIELERHSAY